MRTQHLVPWQPHGLQRFVFRCGLVQFDIRFQYLDITDSGGEIAPLYHAADDLDIDRTRRRGCIAR